MVSPVQQDEAGWTAAAPAAEAPVTLTAKPVFMSQEEAGQLTGVSRDTIIVRSGADETDAVMADTRRKVPLGAFGAGRSLPQRWRWQRRPRR
jgi:hypothetical protein